MEGNSTLPIPTGNTVDGMTMKPLKKKKPTWFTKVDYDAFVDYVNDNLSTATDTFVYRGLDVVVSDVSDSILAINIKEPEKSIAKFVLFDKLRGIEYVMTVGLTEHRWIRHYGDGQIFMVGSLSIMECGNHGVFDNIRGIMGTSLACGNPFYYMIKEGISKADDKLFGGQYRET